MNRIIALNSKLIFVTFLKKAVFKKFSFSISRYCPFFFNFLIGLSENTLVIFFSKSPNRVCQVFFVLTFDFMTKIQQVSREFKSFGCVPVIFVIITFLSFPVKSKNNVLCHCGGLNYIFR